MPIADYDQYQANGMVISVSGGFAYIAQPNLAPGNGAGSLVRILQSGSLRGGMTLTSINTGASTSFLMGVSFLHSQRNITGGAGSFYAIGQCGAHLRLQRYHSDAASPGTVTVLRDVLAAPTTLGVYWDANASGLGGVRITAYDALSGGLFFDLLDIFNFRTYSSGEGVLCNDLGTGASAYGKAIDFAFYSLT